MDYWALYCRVSRRDQNPLNQRLELEDYARRMGYQFKVFEEVESSRNSRPIKSDVLNRLRKKEFRGVIVWRLDRWARSLREMVLEVEELVEKGVPFVSLRDSIDLSTSSGRLTFHIFSALAEFERGVIRERTLLGLDRARAQGKRLGRPAGSKDSKKRSKSGYYLRYQKSK